MRTIANSNLAILFMFLPIRTNCVPLVKVSGYLGTLSFALDLFTSITPQKIRMMATP